jgi:hypothetical protein
LEFFERHLKGHHKLRFRFRARRAGSRLIPAEPGSALLDVDRAGFSYSHERETAFDWLGTLSFAAGRTRARTTIRNSRLKV